MRRFCGFIVDEAGETCVKKFSFYSTLGNFILVVEKLLVFTTKSTRVLHGFFHAKIHFFSSVNEWFLPTINIVNKNNNYIKLNINYWRILV